MSEENVLYCPLLKTLGGRKLVKTSVKTRKTDDSQLNKDQRRRQQLCGDHPAAAPDHQGTLGRHVTAVGLVGWRRGGSGDTRLTASTPSYVQPEGRRGGEVVQVRGR